MSKPVADQQHKSASNKTEPIQILSASCTEDVSAAEILQQVFPSEGLSSEASADALQKAVNVVNLGGHIDQWLEDEVKCHNVSEPAEGQEGRLGPTDVTFQFDIHTNVGTLIVDQDRLGLSSQSNFSSMRANCCVYSGKWMYEVMLGSKGVMQVGWCTVKCKFSQEEGVGDTPDSYAYDGNRQRKWNKTTQKYGELWYTGDVITCAIDCDNGVISFFRNGKNLGEAFTNVRFGPGYAYFPAVSLSLNENLRANFGATPLRYPVEGYEPLQSPPSTDIVKTDVLLRYVEQLLYIDMEDTQTLGKVEGGKSVADAKPAPLTDRRTRRVSLLLIVSQVFEKLAPYLKNSYLAEQCLMKLLLRLNDVDMVTSPQPIILKLLDYMWAFMQGFEIKTCLESVMSSLLWAYRFAPATTDFTQPKRYLTIVLAILRHQQTRRYLLEHELFDKLKFPMFMHIKPHDDTRLEEIVPVVWWDMTSQDEEDVEMTGTEKDKKDRYIQACDTLGQKIEEIEAVQIEMLKVLLCHNDLTDGTTSRMLFMTKFRKFVRENRTNALMIWPLPVTLCFFHRMVQVLRFYWDDFQQEDPTRFVHSDGKERFGLEKETNLSKPPPAPNRRLCEIKKIRTELRSLRKRYKRSSNVEREGIVQLREQIRSRLKTLTNAERLRRKRREKTKKRAAFISNPYKFTKDLLSEEKSGKLESSQDEVEQYLRETHSDPHRSETLGECERIQPVDRHGASTGNQYLNAFMPIQEFWSDTRDYFDLQRCGGSMGHLNRLLGSEVNKAQGLELSADGQVKTADKKPKESEEYPKAEMPSGNTLMDLLDGVMLMYHIAAHKQLGKMNVLKENIQEFIQSYKDTIKKLDSCPIEMSDVRDELVRAKTVFIDKITEQARQICWVRAVVYSKQKQQDVAWLFKAAMKTVEKASQYKMLFQFMPEFYLEIVIHAHTALKNYFQPYVPFESLPDYTELMKSFALFLVNHFANSRVVISDTRDHIIQALACFTCYERSLKVLESLPLDSCKLMLRNLIAPYESRSWAQTNWILVRIWKGCGFGFRYTHLPHLVPSKQQLTEFGSASLQKPCPSPKFQSLLADVLNAESELATRFIDTLLNQLNWSFSEFIGMMQEIQQVISRMERRVLLESRQLKICGTCFDISVCLFRVIEMVVAIAPNLFTDWSKPSAELLLHRLIQLICLVLTRLTTKNGMFDSVVSLYISGLECVTHYPMLSVIAGILITLVQNTDSDCQKTVTRILLSDAGFQLSGLEFMLNNHGDKTVEAGATAKKPKEKQFDFRNYNEVSSEETSCVESLIKHMKGSQATFVRQDSDIGDEELCHICYANRQSTVFRPCGHHSCRSCINHQLLIKKECFFCKSVINSIEDVDISKS